MQNNNNVINITEGLETLVKHYQETGDERFFDIIFNAYRSRIQGRALLNARKYGVEDVDSEHVLCTALWDAAKTYDTERGIPFSAYVNIKFGQSLTYLFKVEKRDNHWFGPQTKGDDYVKNLDQESIQRIVYTLGEDEEGDEWNRADLTPRADVANFVADEDAVESLLQTIREEAGEAEANVAILKALGYSQREIAKALNYRPEGFTTAEAQNMWVKRRLKKCIAPTEKHYAMMGMRIPITLRA